MNDANELIMQYVNWQYISNCMEVNLSQMEMSKNLCVKL